MTLPETLRLLKAKRLSKEEAVQLIMPELDRLLSLDLLPVVGQFAEGLSDLFLRPLACCIVNAALRGWARERKLKKVAK